MLQRIDVSGVHFTVDAKIQKYVERKVGRLDRYIPRQSRASAHAEVKLKGHNAKDKRRYTCEVILHAPREQITVNETAMNMFAAVDIVEEKLKIQLKKYKETHTDPKLHRRFIARLRRA